MVADQPDDAPPFLLARREEDVVWLTLNRPSRLNAVHLAMRDELWLQLGLLRDDPTVRVAVLQGAGDRAFSAGADITEFGTAPSYVEAREARTDRDLWGLMSALSLPLIAAIHGYAYGAGLEMSLYCDIRVAAEDALLAIPEVTLGYIPSAGGSQTLARHVPPAVALRMATTGEPITAREAYDLGLVHEVVPRAELPAAARRRPPLGRSARRASAGGDPCDQTCHHRWTGLATRAGPRARTPPGGGPARRRSLTALEEYYPIARDSASRTPAPSLPARLSARLRRWDARGRLTLLGLALVAIFGIGGVVWGGLFAGPHIEVQQLDAGPVNQFAIGQVVAYPDDNVYLVGINDGRIRAIDGIVKDSGCAVQWDPADERTRAANDGHAAGSYTDPCSGNVWTNAGNAFSGAQTPLRTFQVSYETNDEGVQHVWVEVIGNRTPRS